MSYYTYFPTRNGESTLEKTLKSLVSQTILPTKIIITDDGSTDKTPEILRRYQKNFPGLFKTITYPDRGTDFRKIVGFYNRSLDYARTQCCGSKFQFVLADDVELPSHYVEFLMYKMKEDPKLVIASGCFDVPLVAPAGAGRLIRESFFTKVATHYPKIYGYESWILQEARQRGYEIKAFNNLHANHLRPLGDVHKFREFGKAMYCLGYHPLFVFGRAVKKFFRAEVGTSTILMFSDYLFCRYQNNDPFVCRLDKESRRKVSNMQLMQIKKEVLALLRKLFGPSNIV